jgi:hypothetical protein
MVGIRLNRNAKNSWRSIAIWAMLPLVVLNGRTVIGCGCSGHFEAECRCNCGDGGGWCSSQKSSYPCRAKHSNCHTAAVHNDKAEAETTTYLHGCNCKGSATHVVIPATIAPIHDTADDVKLSASILDSIDLPSQINEQTVRVSFLEHSTLAPRDLVVSLRRLVI